MKKTITAILTIALLTAMLALSACGTTQATTDEVATEVATEATTEVVTETELTTEVATPTPTEAPIPKPRKSIEPIVEYTDFKMTVIYDSQLYELNITSIFQPSLYLSYRYLEPFLRPDVKFDISNKTIEVSESSAYINENFYEGEERKVIAEVNKRTRLRNENPDSPTKIISVVAKIDISFSEYFNEIYVWTKCVFISKDDPLTINYALDSIDIYTEKDGDYIYLYTH